MPSRAQRPRSLYCTFSDLDSHLVDPSLLERGRVAEAQLKIAEE